jgi:hypothetical protein
LGREAHSIRYQGALLAARTGAGKTYLAIALACALLSGHMLGTMRSVPGESRILLPATAVVLVPSHLFSQWRQHLYLATGSEGVLVVENVLTLRKLTPALMARHRFVLVNGTFLTTNTGALRTEWDVVRQSLAVVTFGLRILDEFTTLIPMPRIHPPSGAWVAYCRPRSLALLHALWDARTSLLVSATPFLSRSDRWSNMLCMASLLRAEYNGRLLFGAVDELEVFQYLGSSTPSGSRHGDLAATRESAAVVTRVLYALRQPYFRVPPGGEHHLSTHLVQVPPSPTTRLCRLYAHPVSMTGVLGIPGNPYPTASVFRTYYDRVDTRGQPVHRTFRRRLAALVARGEADIRDLPDTAVCPVPVLLLQSGPPHHRLEMPVGLPETPSRIPDVWLALARLMESAGEGARSLLYIRSEHLTTMEYILVGLGISVLVLKGNSKQLSARIAKFKGGHNVAMVVPDSHVDGMDLPMTTHIFVPYRPTTCNRSCLRQLVGRVRRHGSTSHTRLVFVAAGMEPYPQREMDAATAFVE